ncbi:DUF4406 domain-containing protein [Mucilaginibacter rubeus]|uniref:DUF4406 domain-containing protein n=1 Tax=Mucilaginibacter rubeus TaxID=2027860 RepID=A0A5C1I699_9SPHI|nr:DUF4406 domain-containing protein [Mucilaginibacter rubeus]QEM13453.1 DUF4406 domain-containing protein [Mucilaginibacter rubeus]
MSKQEYFNKPSITAKEWQQRRCSHMYTPWEHKEEILHDRDRYERVCVYCDHVQDYIGRLAPEGYIEPKALPVPASEAAQFQNKIDFLVQLASIIVTQRGSRQVVYIAGKVTGLAEHTVKHKFSKMKNELQGRGFIVLNPCDFIPFDCDWQIAMRMASTLLMMADCIYMLPCWGDSKGAKMEFEMAAAFGINVISE